MAHIRLQSWRAPSSLPQWTIPSIVDPVGYCSSVAALIHKNGTITRLLPSLSTDGVFFQALRSPIKFAAPGLNSAGFVSLACR
mmetsp:Transcript_12264/g.22266  ORF Transcript_12264/g.22266 Transcript_12264/m.22266 type:complete len:83 (-) Transcript_12264:104-352(-)